MEEDAVGVADDARDMSHGGDEVRMAGEAGFRYPSRTPTPPLSIT